MVMTKDGDQEVEEWFERRRLTLDIAGRSVRL